MNPNKIQWYLGSSSYAMLMDQDRKHWLMKTDKKKQVQDNVTGDVFQGRLDNLGSDIIAETEKLYTKDPVTHNGTFSSENVSDVFDINASVFPFTPALLGLHFLRLKSINLMVSPSTYSNFRMVLENVETLFVPMAPDPSSPDVCSYKWYRTSSVKLQCQNSAQQWAIEQPIEFSDGVTNPVFYFPADVALQPITVSQDGDSLVTPLITDEMMIGMPLVWFTCDESTIGPQIDIENNQTASSQYVTYLLNLGHEGNAVQHTCKLYPVISTDIASTPPGTTDTSAWEMIINNPTEGEFVGDVSDYRKPIDTVVFHYTLSDTFPDVTVKFNNIVGNNKVAMSMITTDGWTYDNGSYSISLSRFEDNEYSQQHPAMESAFDVYFDKAIPYEDTSTDMGYVGFQFGSSKNHEDQLPRYPHNMVDVEGMPDHIRKNDPNSTPQHLSVYALHNTPNYDPSDPTSRQMAALVFDPGVERTHDYDFHPGQYRLLSTISVVNKGSGYDFKITEITENGYLYNGDFYSDASHTTQITPDPAKFYVDIPSGVMYIYDADNTSYTALGTDHIPNRFRIRFNTGELSNTLFEIASTDENGGVESIRPIYADPGETSDVRQTVFAYYSNGHMYEDSAHLIEIDPGDPTVVYQDKTNGHLYEYITDQFVEVDYNEAGSAFEMTYDPDTLVGSYLQAVWNASTGTHEAYTIDELTNVRQSQLGGTGDGLMPSGKPWWYYTYTTGVGLIVNVNKLSIHEEVAPFDEGDIPTEEIGRVYMLSNDAPRYMNNGSVAQPKPARTIARICDIPTSIAQLTNVHGVAPTTIVDKKYVRSLASFTENDLEYLYNGSKNRWVRPTDLGTNGLPVYDNEQQTNKFVFDSMDELRRVDLVYHNDYRQTINLNQSVSPDNVHISSIPERGLGYSIGASGILVVGGYSFVYIVDEVSELGEVLQATLLPNGNPGDEINLSNFDFDGATGTTIAYGTSPFDADVSGKGLKLILQVEGYVDLLPQKGDIFTDLYAFVRDISGIWLAAYENGAWRQVELLAQSFASETIVSQGDVSLRDSYMNSILPTFHKLPVNPIAPYSDDRLLDAFVTASSINVVSDTLTPVTIPSTSDETQPIDDRVVVDFSKLYCRGINELEARGRNESYVLQKIKESCPYDIRYDSYIIWRWMNESDMNNNFFIYGVIHRSLNNLQSTAETTTLPPNDLNVKNYVHTNSQTSIMWNVPHIGPMVWMFDMYSKIHEKYYVNAHTRDLYVVRKEFKWDEIEISNATGDTKYNLVENGIMQFNVMSNNPAYIPMSINPQVIYQQPNFTTIFRKGDSASSIVPQGAWRLVFPSLVDSFKLTGVTDGREFTPVRMNVLRGSNISNTTDVLNYEGDPVNYKTLLVDENSATQKVNMRMYNHESHTWIEV